MSAKKLFHVNRLLVLLTAGDFMDPLRTNCKNFIPFDERRNAESRDDEKYLPSTRPPSGNLTRCDFLSRWHKVSEADECFFFCRWPTTNMVLSFPTALGTG